MVSVCVPVFNGSPFIERCLKNILTQSYSNIEVLVIDDNSTDSSSEIIEEISKSDDRIIFNKNSNSLGLAANWNECLKKARGDWIKFQFQDDLMIRNTIQKMLDFSLQNQTLLTLSNRDYVFNTTDKKTINFYKKLRKLDSYIRDTRIVNPDEVVDIANKTLLQRNFLGEPIVGLFHRKLIKKYGYFNPKFYQLIDFEFWLRITSNMPFGFINEELNVFRVHNKSATAKTKQYKGFNRSSLDRLNIVRFILSDDLYQNYRLESEKLGYPIRNLLNDFLRKMVRKDGSLQIKKHLDDLLMPSLTLADKIAGVYKDFLHRNW
ncbi:MAG: glycosyltransferase family 2 protein [Ekhidna sp.]|nr:glycosyltransferase family 2 protein [Ekhidna sp.]